MHTVSINEASATESYIISGGENVSEAPGLTRITIFLVLETGTLHFLYEN
jgi:hypothetical protein